MFSIFYIHGTKFETEQSHGRGPRVPAFVSRTVTLDGKILGQILGQISTEWVLTPRTNQGQACIKIKQGHPRHLRYAIQRYGHLFHELSLESQLVRLSIITGHTKGT
jgi:hypothetical protein